MRLLLHSPPCTSCALLAITNSIATTTRPIYVNGFQCQKILRTRSSFFLISIIARHTLSMSMSVIATTIIGVIIFICYWVFVQAWSDIFNTTQHFIDWHGPIVPVTFKHNSTFAMKKVYFGVIKRRNPNLTSSFLF